MISLTELKLRREKKKLRRQLTEVNEQLAKLNQTNAELKGIAEEYRTRINDLEGQEDRNE